MRRRWNLPAAGQSGELTARQRALAHDLQPTTAATAQLVIEVESNRQAARALATASGHAIIGRLGPDVPAESVLGSRRSGTLAERASVVLPDSLS